MATEFPVPTAASSPGDITAGPDDNLWFTEMDRQPDRPDHHGRRHHGVSDPHGQQCSSRASRAGTDGNLWFTEADANQIGRITPAGVITEFPVPTANSRPTRYRAPVRTATSGSPRTAAPTRSAGSQRPASSREFRHPHARQLPGRDCGRPGRQSLGNVELVIKVLDGTAINGHFWVFYGALSNVQYTITVTDTQTQAVKTYTNPSGTLASVADTSAF